MTKEPKHKALVGLLPLILFYCAAGLLAQTKWCWDNPALALLVTCPLYCYLATK